MYQSNFADVGFRFLTALVIILAHVLALGYVFQYGHSMSFAELLYPLLNS